MSIGSTLFKFFREHPGLRLIVEYDAKPGYMRLKLGKWTNTKSPLVIERLISWKDFTQGKLDMVQFELDRMAADDHSNFGRE